MRAKICGALKLSLPDHLDRRCTDEARLPTPAIDPVPHPGLELEIRRQSHCHSVHETPGLHQRNELFEEDCELLSRDAFRRPTRVDRRQEEPLGFVDVADSRHDALIEYGVTDLTVTLTLHRREHPVRRKTLVQ